MVFEAGFKTFAPLQRRREIDTAGIQRVAIEESGPKDFDADTVVGFDAPAGTSPEVVSHLNREINRELGSQGFNDRIAALDGGGLPLTPAELGGKAVDDSRRFDAIIRDRDILGD